MLYHTPDNWVILKIIQDSTVVYKILGGWSGGYLHGDSWRINSGVSSIEEDSNYYYFFGHSGSCYKCHKDQERLSLITNSVFQNLMKSTQNKNITVEIINSSSLDISKFQNFS